MMIAGACPKRLYKSSCKPIPVAALMQPAEKAAGQPARAAMVPGEVSP
tara:strand:- start:2956 stop:3099 length:144 start_codon:yes stop_codon:yes gene_type:complete